jgi:hypothetical protein
LNVAALAWLASAPPPPEPTVEGAVSTDTTLSWKQVPGAASYVIRWRRTDASQWQEHRVANVLVMTDCRIPCPDVFEKMGRAVDVLPHIRVDDWVFGVSSVSKDGFESPIASAVPGGAFKPYVPPVKVLPPLDGEGRVGEVVKYAALAGHRTHSSPSPSGEG